MKIILYLVLIGIGIYLASAFISWEPNPANWNEGGRAVVVFAWLFISGGFVVTRGLP